MSIEAFRTGFIAIVGRPNVGKSTLMNRLIGQKISITSRKAQTTRHRITGIHTDAHTQFIFVDTPGFQTQHQNALNRVMNKSVTHALKEVDVVLFLIEGTRFDERDRKVIPLLPADRPVLLVINKVDRLEDKNSMLPFIQEMAKEYNFAAIVPVSAKQGTQMDVLLDAIRAHLPEGAPMFGEDEVTDRSERFLASEIIREKIFRLLGEEVPYSVSVMIEKFEMDGTMRRIHAAILVDKANQKAIIIGKGGEKLKEISTQARKDMEKLFDGKVFLETWVKLKGGWADDERALKSLGYD
jgi:GTP-binding protein Era